MEKTKKARLGGKLRGIRELLGVFGAFALIFVLLSVLPGVSEKFLAPSNLFNIARQITVNIVLACGLTMAILIGGIDLSVGSVIAISGCLVGGLMTNNGLPVYAAIAIGLASGAVFGAVNGLVISRTNIPPFIVTLATMYVGRGIVRLYTDSSTILITDDVFSYIGSGKLFGVVPIQIIYIVVLCLVTWFILNRTKFGRHIYAVGDNEQAALFTGINVRRVKLTVYVLVGLFAAIAGILNAARTSAGLYTSGEGYEMDAIADPHATSIVYRSRCRNFVNIGNNVSSRVVMTPEEAERRFRHPIIQVVMSIAREWFKDEPRVSFHDPLAAVCIFNDDVCSYKRGYMDCVLDSRLLGGMTIFREDPAGPHQVAWDVDGDKFFEHLFEVFA